MFFQKAAIIAFLIGSHMQVQAGPVSKTVESTDEDLVIIKVEAVGNETLTWYGEGPSANISTVVAPVPQACGTNDVTCSTSHLATSSVCASLIGVLQSNGGATVAASPRAVCLTQSGNQCCVSWSAVPAGTLFESFLVSAAQKVQAICANTQTVSGLARNVLLGPTCVTQCLSNRPDGCS